MNLELVPLLYGTICKAFAGPAHQDEFLCICLTDFYAQLVLAAVKYLQQAEKRLYFLTLPVSRGLPSPYRKDRHSEESRFHNPVSWHDILFFHAR